MRTCVVKLPADVRLHRACCCLTCVLHTNASHSTPPAPLSMQQAIPAEATVQQAMPAVSSCPDRIAGKVLNRYTCRLPVLLPQDRILVFHRGMGMEKLSGLLIDQKLDLLMDYTVFYLLDKILDKVKKPVRSTPPPPPLSSAATIRPIVKRPPCTGHGQRQGFCR